VPMQSHDSQATLAGRAVPEPWEKQVGLESDEDSLTADLDDVDATPCDGLALTAAAAAATAAVAEARLRGGSGGDGIDRDVAALWARSGLNQPSNDAASRLNGELAEIRAALAGQQKHTQDLFEMIRKLSAPQQDRPSDEAAIATVGGWKKDVEALRIHYLADMAVLQDEMSELRSSFESLKELGAAPLELRRSSSGAAGSQRIAGLPADVQVDGVVTTPCALASADVVPADQKLVELGARLQAVLALERERESDLATMRVELEDLKCVIENRERLPCHGGTSASSSSGHLQQQPLPQQQQGAHCCPSATALAALHHEVAELRDGGSSAQLLVEVGALHEEIRSLRQVSEVLRQCGPLMTSKRAQQQPQQLIAGTGDVEALRQELAELREVVVQREMSVLECEDIQGSHPVIQRHPSPQAAALLAAPVACKPRLERQQNRRSGCSLGAAPAAASVAAATPAACYLESNSSGNSTTRVVQARSGRGGTGQTSASWAAAPSQPQQQMQKQPRPVVHAGSTSPNPAAAAAAAAQAAAAAVASQRRCSLSTMRSTGCLA